MHDARKDACGVAERVAGLCARGADESAVCSASHSCWTTCLLACLLACAACMYARASTRCVPCVCDQGLSRRIFRRRTRSRRHKWRGRGRCSPPCSR